MTFQSAPTKTVFPLGDLFANGLNHTPDRSAIADGRYTLTFQELDDLAWRIAAHLRQTGTRPGDRIAVISAKSALMPAVAVAIWKCGAVYVPLDQDAPEARLDALIVRMRPKQVIALERPYRDTICPVLQPKHIEALYNSNNQPDRWDIPQRSTGDLAYIIFTSGSTGTPKGVEITHENISTYFQAHNDVLQFTPDSRVLSFAPFHFDVSIEDTLLPLAVGAFSYQYRGLYVGVVIRKIMASEDITHMIAVSTILTLISTPRTSVGAATFPKLTMVMTGAEVCDPDVVNHWVAALPNARIINAYGPTEVTIVCLCHHIKYAEPGRIESFPIGAPLKNVDVLLLDEEGNETDEGELCLGGPLVMRGYFEHDDLTNQVIFERDGVRYYRSGDFCKRNASGDIVFVGRRDDEVKLKGKRIHLGEIRQLALSFKGVERAAIGTVDRQNEKHISLIIISPDANILSRLRSFLQTQLPPYMRPSIWATGSDVTLSASGKTDEKVLLNQLRIAAKTTEAVSFELAPDATFQPKGIDAYAQ